MLTAPNPGCAIRPRIVTPALQVRLPRVELVHVAAVEGVVDQAGRRAGRVPVEQADHVFAEANILVRRNRMGCIATPVVAAHDFGPKHVDVPAFRRNKVRDTIAMWSQPVSRSGAVVLGMGNSSFGGS